MARKNEMIAPDVVDRYRSGEPVKTIMAEFGLSQDTIYRMVDQAGVARRGRGNRLARGSGDSATETSGGTEVVTPESTRAKKATAKQKSPAKRTAKKSASKQASAKQRSSTRTGEQRGAAATTRGGGDRRVGDLRTSHGGRTMSALVGDLVALQQEIDELAGALAEKEQTRKDIAALLAAP